MKYKKLLLVSSILFLLVFTAMAFAEEQQTTSEILTQKVGVAVDDNTKAVTYTFTDSESALKIGKNDYWNIQPQTNNTPAYIKTDNSNNVIGAEFKVNQNGGTYVFGNDKVNVPPNSRVIFKSGKLIIDSPENSEIKDLPSRIDKPDNNLKDNIIELTGKNLKLPNDATLQDGVLDYKNGQFYVPNNNYVKINGVDIDALEGNGNVNIYFGKLSENQEGVGLDFKDKTFEMNYFGKSSKPNVYFFEGNPFINIEGKDSFSIRPTGDFFKVDITDRKIEDKIPKVVLTGEGKINDDGKNLYTDKLGKIYLEDNWMRKSSTSTPIELFVNNKDGTPTNDKYLISNFREFAGNVPVGSEEYSKENYGGTIIPKQIKTSWTYNYPTEQSLLEKYGVDLDLKIGDQFDKPEVLRKITDFYEVMPEGMREGIKSIVILDETDFRGEVNRLLNIDTKKDDKWTSSTWGFVYPTESPDEIYLKGDDFSLSTLRHEAGHVFEGTLIPDEIKKQIVISQKELNAKAEEMIKKGSELDEEEKALGDSPSLEKQSAFFEKRSAILLNELADLHKVSDKLHETMTNYQFGKEWVDLSGGKEVYNKGVYIKNTELEWKDPKIDERINYLDQTVKEEIKKGVSVDEVRKKYQKEYDALFNTLSSTPRYGFIRPYGATSFSEDVATYMEQINNPSFFKELIDPKSPKYDARYKQKLDLLLNYGFISQAEYNAVFK